MHYSIDNQLQHEDLVMQYDCETNEMHAFSIDDKELAESVIIDGQINGNPIIASEIPGMNTYVVHEWSNGNLGKQLASFPMEMRTEEGNNRVQDVLAWIDGWTYLSISCSSKTDGMIFQNCLVRIKEDQCQLLGTQKYLGFERAQVSDQGSVAYWDYLDDYYGIHFAQPIDPEWYCPGRLRFCTIMDRHSKERSNASISEFEGRSSRKAFIARSLS